MRKLIKALAVALAKCINWCEKKGVALIYATAFSTTFVLTGSLELAIGVALDYALIPIVVLVFGIFADSENKEIRNALKTLTFLN